MPRRFLTNAEREQLRRFPTNIAPNDVITYFTLTQADLTEILKRTGDYNRLGFAMQLCALRYLGFCPEDLTTAPADAVVYVARQLELVELGVEPVEPEALRAYGERAQTRTDNLRAVERYLGFRQASAEDLDKLFAWLVERALEHDRPTLLLQMACEKLHQEKFIWPSITHGLEPTVLRARSFARQETFRRIAPILTDDLRVLLDELLTVDLALGITPLTWLRQPATSNSPNAIQAVLKKLVYLKEWEVDRWDLTTLNPNRLKFLAQIGRKSTNQALQRTPEERRYPILIAFLRQSLVDITDEAIDMFDRCLAGAYARAGRDLDEFRKSVGRATNEKVALFREIGRVILDEQIEDAFLRAVIYQRIPKEILQAAVKECDTIIRPLDDSYFDFLESRYNYIRQFAPVFLDAFTFQCNPESELLLEAVDLLRHLNAEERRKIPDEAPIDFIPPKWRPYVVDKNYCLDRHYYELCVLWELRNALRAGDVWLEESRRYANPETYLIPKDQWPTLREEVCQQLGVPEDGATRLKERGAELETLLTRVDLMLKQDGKDGKVRMDGDDLVVSPLSAEERPESAVRLEQQIDQRLPLIDLSDLLIEVDSWTHFTQHFEHAAGSEPRSPDLLPHLYASIIAQGCNLGRTQMAQMADLSEDLLTWCSNWYIRDDTLKAAVAAIVNFQYNQPLSQFWGGGILSSSDGQRFPASGKVRNAEALPRYFGYGRGVTFYTWTSDQFSQYGTKVISATVRDATYVLDEILDNETELEIVEHTTDTSGYTEIIFALFDLLGMQFSPRIRDIGTQRLYRLDQNKTYSSLEPQLKGKVNQEFILRRWDDLLRVAGSLKMGWVTASLFISKLQSYPRRNVLTWALQEYGRLVKTIFILRYLESEEYRRRINTQINKGEALHGLRQFLFFANGGKIRRKQEEDQNNVASCLNLITNAVVVWNTVYMTAAIEQLKTEGYPVREKDIAHLSPARYEHLNPYGKYYFDIDAIDARFGITQLRPLRQPKSVGV